jgi:hypothetical protein
MFLANDNWVHELIGRSSVGALTCRRAVWHVLQLTALQRQKCEPLNDALPPPAQNVSF